MASHEDLEARYEAILAHDNDAEYGAVDDETIIRESRRHSRTLAFAAGGIVLSGALVGGALLVTANQHPTPRAAVTAEPFTTSTAPSATETSASPSPSKTSASPSPSKSKTASPTPSESHSATSIPSPTRSTHKVELPSVEPTTSAPETHSSAPQNCTWETTGTIVTVGDCGTRTVFNSPQHTGAHELSVGMQFQNACLISGVVRIEYGGSYDYTDNYGYYPVSGAC